jgi:ferredoxin-NADP reductase
MIVADGIGPSEMNEPTLNLVITRREQQADDVVVLDLAAPDGHALQPFEPGAHVDIILAPGLVRQYSLCGSPTDRSRYRLGILLAPDSRGGSAEIHKVFRVGEQVRVSPPRNLFPLAADAMRSILVGGGIGITPLLAMAYHLDQTGQGFALHYCARERRKAAFLDELGATSFSHLSHLHFDDGPAEQRFDPKRDLTPVRPGTHIYICGPAGFMDWVIAAARELGYAEAQIHREYFSAEVDSEGDAFEVVLERSKRTVTVPSGVTIVQALADAGVAVEVSCEQGICGTCLCQVIEGTPDHRDGYLTAEERAENDQMLLCCSRAKTPRLVLDL